jgi:phosphoenolpyruvate carboxykinase (GTP)
MAMKPFCGYNFADYWRHWLSFSERSQHLPGIFHVNWFRQDNDGKFLWPGFGENLRVIRWIIDRCEGRAEARETPIGFLPRPADIDISGLDVATETMEALLSVNLDAWRDEMDSVGEYLDSYGERLPEQLKQEHATVVEDLKKAG